MRIVVATSEFFRPDAALVAQLRAAAGALDDMAFSDIGAREQHGRDVQSADILFGQVVPEALPHARQLRWIHTIGAAIEGLPEALAGRRVLLTGEKGNVGPPLAEQAFALLLALTRGVATALREPGPHMRMPIRECQWELADRVMAIIGFGGTGRALARRARGFEVASVVAVDPEPVANISSIDRVYRPEDIDACLGTADIVVICAPLTAATRHWFNHERFAAMKPGAILINVGRGEIVEEAALMEALRSGRLFGAGLDVAPRDPLPADHPLWRMPNVVVTPHVAGGSPLRMRRAVDNFCANLARFRQGTPLNGVIDLQKGF